MLNYYSGFEIFCRLLSLLFCDMFINLRTLVNARNIDLWLFVFNFELKAVEVLSKTLEFFCHTCASGKKFIFGHFKNSPSLSNLAFHIHHAKLSIFLRGSFRFEIFEKFIKFFLINVQVHTLQLFDELVFFFSVNF